MKFHQEYLFLLLCIVCLVLPLALPDTFTPAGISGGRTNWAAPPAVARAVYFGIGVLLTTITGWYSAIELIKDYREKSNSTVTTEYRVILAPNASYEIFPIRGGAGTTYLRISFSQQEFSEGFEILINVFLQLDGHKSHRRKLGSLVWSKGYRDRECETMVRRNDNWIGRVELQNMSESECHQNIAIKAWFPVHGELQLPRESIRGQNVMPST